MAVDGRGAKGQPTFDGNKASNTAADQNAIGDYASRVGNRIADASGKRTAFATSFPELGNTLPWEGLEYLETDTGYLYRFTSSAWVLLVGDGTVGSAGSVNLNPSSDYGTVLRIAHGIVSLTLAADPGQNSLSASSTNSLMAGIPVGFRPKRTLVRRAEWRSSSNWADTQQWARIRISTAGAVEVVYTTATIPSGALLSLEASWPAA